MHIFSIPKREHVTLKVYNIIGQDVATLVDNELEAGEFYRTKSIFLVCLKS
jgi:hypothetical protein